MIVAGETQYNATTVVWLKNKAKDLLKKIVAKNALSKKGVAQRAIAKSRLLAAGN